MKGFPKSDLEFYKLKGPKARYAWDVAEGAREDVANPNSKWSIKVLFKLIFGGIQMPDGSVSGPSGGTPAGRAAVWAGALNSTEFEGKEKPATVELMVRNPNPRGKRKTI